eukprot:93473-Hanusia_phi.AAC.1
MEEEEGGGDSTGVEAEGGEVEEEETVSSSTALPDCDAQSCHIPPLLFHGSGVHVVYKDAIMYSRVGESKAGGEEEGGARRKGEGEREANSERKSERIESKIMWGRGKKERGMTIASAAYSS